MPVIGPPSFMCAKQIWPVSSKSYKSREFVSRTGYQKDIHRMLCYLKRDVNSKQQITKAGVSQRLKESHLRTSGGSMKRTV